MNRLNTARTAVEIAISAGSVVVVCGVLVAVTTLFVRLAWPAPAHAPLACKDVDPKLPELAQRLGVPARKDAQGIVLSMCDGRQYEFSELLNALLDRMDRAEQLTRKGSSEP